MIRVMKYILPFQLWCMFYNTNKANIIRFNSFGIDMYFSQW